MPLRTRALLTPPKTTSKPSQRTSQRTRQRTSQRTSQGKRRQEILPSKKKKGSGAPTSASTGKPHRKAMRRASVLRSSDTGGSRSESLRELGPPRAGALAFRRPTAALRGFHPGSASGRASWNHRMQAGGPSPAPVQRAPRSPTRAGRDVAQAAREHSVWPRPREPLPLRLKEYPRDKAPFVERDFGDVTVMGTDVKGNVALFGTDRRADWRAVMHRNSALATNA